MIKEHVMRTKYPPKLCSVMRQLPLISPPFYLKIEAFVPYPSIERPEPRIFVFLSGSNGTAWGIARSLAELQSFMALTHEELRQFENALLDSLEITARLPYLVRVGNQIVDSETGEIMYELCPPGFTVLDSPIPSADRLELTLGYMKQVYDECFPRT